MLRRAAYDDAIEVCRQLLVAENPTYNLAHDCLAYAYWGKRMYPQVMEQWNAYYPHTGNKEDAAFGDAAGTRIPLRWLARRTHRRRQSMD